MLNSSTKNSFWIDCISQNEINSGFPTSIGQRDLLFRNIYKSFNYLSGYDPSSSRRLSSENRNQKYHGPIYNLCFSPDGKKLIGGTEESALLIFDPLNHRLIKQIDDAHENSVNYIKFIDSNLFATCSNDKNIALWDIRNVKSKLRLLTDGHSHFIKNLEYDPNHRYLVSSGFDGAVNIWDIYNSSEQLEPGFTRGRPQDCPFKKILSLNCLMRMRMTYDFTKMIISTVEGYMMVIHDLDLLTLKEDLSEFQSDLYRLMQKKHSSEFDFGSWLNPLFVSKRNRVELISDFPNENEAHLIGSLDVHPQNWCILNRNLSRDENSEFTCIHNIQDYEKPNKMMYIEIPKKDKIYFPHAELRNNTSRESDYSPQEYTQEQSRLEVESMSIESNDNNRIPVNQHIQFSSTLNREQPNPNDLHYSPLIIISARSSRRAQAQLLNPNTSYRKIKEGTPLPKVFCNLNRMTHYVEELNVYKLFFKESYFSACGRLIGSPNGFGFRLLSFNDECTELSDQILSSSFSRPQKLKEINCFTNHSNFVTTIRFSPTHHLIASGCLNGQINFYQPCIE